MSTSALEPSVWMVTPAIFDFEAQPKELIGACQLCGAYFLCRDVKRDRYGYRVKVSQCEGCGLHQFSERMTREAYARFYETAYRPLVSAFHGREINAQTIQPEQYEYGRRLAKILDPWRDEWESATVLDIGGSTGAVVSELSLQLCFYGATVLDPSPLELCEMPVGVEPILGTIETFDADGRTWDLITLCQTADHLLDLMGSLRKIKGLLSPGGLFWSDIVNFDKTREVKIDHPFNLTERTYREFLKRAGFELLQVNYAPDGVHIGFLAR